MPEQVRLSISMSAEERRFIRLAAAHADSDVGDWAKHSLVTAAAAVVGAPAPQPRVTPRDRTPATIAERWGRTPTDVRIVLRDALPDLAPGSGGRWAFDDESWEQALAAVRARYGAEPTG